MIAWLSLLATIMSCQWIEILDHPYQNYLKSVAHRRTLLEEAGYVKGVPINSDPVYANFMLELKHTYYKTNYRYLLDIKLCSIVSIVSFWL